MASYFTTIERSLIPPTLLDRMDTKYVTTLSKLLQMLPRVREQYLLQTTGSQAVATYHTRYYDTPSRDMYLRHLHGAATRFKVRTRRYESTGDEFLEVKRKDNHGLTHKTRLPVSTTTRQERDEFIREHAGYPPASLQPVMESRFKRLTLISKELSERVTVDTDIHFHNLYNNKTHHDDRLVVIEIKRDARYRSELADVLRAQRIFPCRYSKYCMGMLQTDDTLSYNRFKPRLRDIEKNLNL